MPIYTYHCQNCFKSFDKIVRLVDFNSPQTCSCGSVGKKQLTAPSVQTDYPGYTCPVTGKWIEGKKAHNENLAKHGCRVLEAGETSNASKAIKKAEIEFDRSVEATAEQFVAGLSARKLEKLANEMQSGVTATVVRQ